jgi:hypothetical protein
LRNHGRLTTTLLALLPAIAAAKFARPVEAPVERLIANTERQLKESPNAAELHYRLGRLHALAAAKVSPEIYGPEDRFDLQSRHADGLPVQPTQKAREELTLAIASYKKANALRISGQYQLGLAWALEAAVQARLPGVTEEQVLNAYQGAFALTEQLSLAEKYQPKRGIETLASHEAASAYLRLWGKRPPKNAVQEQLLNKLRAHLELLRKLPEGAVTPVVFALRGEATLESLRDPGRCSTFDLDGTGQGACWEWLSPRAGILVWDPAGKGAVKNGWQLFGSASFFLFFDHGYQALEALDDDGDGWLAGRELVGIGVWSDADRDGHPRAAEVRTVQTVGIRRIAVRAVQRPDGLWHQPRGLEFDDGSLRPTWDWVSMPQAAATSHPGASK